MTTLRSEEMVKGTLVLPSALPLARRCLDLLGRKGSVHFIDMNAHCLTRQFNTYIQRIDEMERIIRFLEGEVQRLQDAGARIVVGADGIQNFLDSEKSYQLDRVEEALNRLYAQFVRFKSNNTDLIQQKNLALQEKCVMQTAAQQLRLAAGGAAATVGRPSSRGDDEGMNGGEGSHAADRYNAERGRQQSLTAAGTTALSEEEVARALLTKPDEEKNEEEAESARGGSSIDLESGFLKTAGRADTSGGASGSIISTVAGMVATADVPSFQRLLFRSTRGNAFCFFQSVAERFVDGKTGKEVEKGVFVIYHQGTTRSLLHEKIIKVCAAFDARAYDWPHSVQEALRRLNALENLLDDKERALAAYEKYFLGEISLLLEVTRPGGSSLLEEWKMFCQKEKAVYATLNMFQGEDMTLRCDCWIPKKREEEVRALLKEVSTDSGEEQASAFLLVEKGKLTAMPPTHFKTTEFTEPAQIMVDTYGVPRYQEANPAVLTTITFPFLFGVMYGDIGHGLCVMALGAYLLVCSSSGSSSSSSTGGSKKEQHQQTISKVSGSTGSAHNSNNRGALHAAIKYRYMIFLMGFFAFFGGFMYNDFFALGIDLCKTRWSWKGATQSGTNFILQKKQEVFPYPFGFDPAWKGAVNELLFTNSFKMKFSVIVGFLHMLAGVLLRGSNALFFSQPLDFFFEFLPQLTFLCALVGYMDFLIVFKWATPAKDGSQAQIGGGTNKPSLINTIIHMCMLNPVEENERLFASQQLCERILFFLMVAALPLMLLPKPLIIMLLRNRKKKKASLGSRHDPRPSKTTGLSSGGSNGGGINNGGGGGSYSGGNNGAVEESGSGGSASHSSGGVGGSSGGDASARRSGSTSSSSVGSSGGGAVGRGGSSRNKAAGASGGGRPAAVEGGGGNGGGEEEEEGGGAVVAASSPSFFLKEGAELFNKGAGDVAVVEEEAAVCGDGVEGKREREGLAAGAVGVASFFVDDSDAEEEGVGDLFIHQMIETIEFVLGTVSNTASYLRLWALSLAHQQLALVFYTQTIVRAVELADDNLALVTCALFFIFAIYACITFAVILCMDFLEVALHALRLQWVEFQNKFFKGDGYKFAPLHFQKLLQEQNGL